ncbi:type II toxin-antitoxin system HicA family toxin [Synechococcus sp. CS-602]|uniref:type II toxin-antitoxin system HicA family toxin n=1 Tax=Synechococcaceae TaxID=1890426 RepID=UPI0008FF0F3E|nr:MULTISPECIES: type II toxin-antitoxin system HicA family toxin [Synechococcaceae]MCT4363736.1 type II toxin-antitoxin system HicA family toxin [Candidatus Regnicoccus frigidus MAG-AL1]MCT0200973.1 type II toxin-antitoxin system HicA family toxin [Synechococcus sp. CS-603]MCT0204933.1 type II toxin-antitoxin system HicA family toxin [Synechococcus sp. CS-602]MCT0244761.1 type II toxin-antitoxin system HicA family toxin [Synechococcus sp. CS-601]MCT4367560.1 type II toxin-antitoxin system Hic
MAVTQSKKVFAALKSIGWRVKRQSGSHKTLEHEGYPDYVFAFHEGVEIGPSMLVQIAKHTGLEPGDL